MRKIAREVIFREGFVTHGIVGWLLVPIISTQVISQVRNYWTLCDLFLSLTGYTHVHVARVGVHVHAHVL